MDFEMQLTLLLRQLIEYSANPSPTLSLNLQHRVLSLIAALRQQQAEMEQRITENVLRSISVRLETNGAITEIESLRKAFERFGK